MAQMTQKLFRLCFVIVPSNRLQSISFLLFLSFGTNMLPGVLVFSSVLVTSQQVRSLIVNLHQNLIKWQFFANVFNRYLIIKFQR